MKEYITNGRDYIDPNSNKTYAANGPMYKEVAAEIMRRSKLLPLTVSGGVGWVCAQTAPKHLRLTLVDAGYLNPGDKTATVTFHTAAPVAITDLLSGERIEGGKTVNIQVPCGLFRFLDIETKDSLL